MGVRPEGRPHRDAAGAGGGGGRPGRRGGPLFFESRLGAFYFRSGGPPARAALRWWCGVAFGAVWCGGRGKKE
jgi:hypothetical protein